MSAAAHAPGALPEICIRVSVDAYAEFVGTAEQLCAEGLIPPGFEWPHADRDQQWEANGFEYRVCRTRPEGHKGHRWSWHGLDSWRLRVRVAGRDQKWALRRHLARKAAELRAELRLLTPEGDRAWREGQQRYWAARTDPAFEAFKEKVPGLVPPKRGRKPKSIAAPIAPSGEVQA